MTAPHPPSSDSERRVLVVPPTARDGEITSTLLAGAGLDCLVCRNLHQLCSEIPAGVGAVLLTSHVLADPALADCIATLEAQPSWSDLPIVLLMQGRVISDRNRLLLQALGNVTLLENPAPARSVVSAVETAVRSRQRQYQIRDHIAACERAESLARRLQEQLSIAMEASELGTFHCPLPLGPITWNAQCKAHFGLDADAEVDFDRFFSLLHPDDREYTHIAVEQCVYGRQPYDVEYRAVLPDGAIRWIRATGKAYYGVDGAPIRFDGTTQDITQRKRAEAELHKNAQRQRLLSEAAEVLLSAADPVSMMQQLFGKISQHLGVDAYFNFAVDETSRTLHLVSAMGVDPEALSSIARLEIGQAVCGTVAQQGRAIAATHIQGSDDPKVQHVKRLGIRAYACNPLIAEGRLHGTLSFASRTRDEFDEGELIFLDAISRYVTMAYVRLRLVEQLREADQRKDDFLATLAHELRNPLAPLSSGLQLIRIAGDDRQVLGDTLGIMERQLRHMVRLIDDLLDLSRITRNKLQLRKERIDLGQVLQDAIETSRPAIEAAGHELFVSLPQQPLVVEADRVRLAQVFGNLLNNAAKYTERGTIRLAAQRRDGEAIVSVADNGIGISAEHLPHLFEMFSQVAPAIERSQGGLGIGLALVRGLVQMHGGSVEARSAGADAGSEFIVRLPLVAAIASAQDASPSAEGAPPAASRRKVLVVDDNRDAAATMARVIQLFGHEVHMAHDGAAAVEEARLLRPHFVLLDIGLPTLNGYEVCRHIRQQPDADAITVIALTGWGQDEDKRKAAEAGFDHHFTKPVDAASLRRILAAEDSRNSRA